jgi:Bacterial self-protective colicin-like immunity
MVKPFMLKPFMVEVSNQINRFLCGEITAKNLSEWYFKAYRECEVVLPDDEGRLLSEIFSDLDEYLPPELSAIRGEYDIDEQELRVRMAQKLPRLKSFI